MANFATTWNQGCLNDILPHNHRCYNKTSNINMDGISFTLQSNAHMCKKETIGRPNIQKPTFFPTHDHPEFTSRQNPRPKVNNIPQQIACSSSL